MHILLVEDDLALGRALQAVLCADGHHVVWVRLGAAVAPQLEAARFDALLLDLGLPDGDGADLLRGLRAAGCGLPALLITAREALADRLAGFDSGADDYLVKPFDMPELLARLRAVARRAHGWDDSPSLALRDLVLDRRAQLVTRAGVPVPLSPTEFALLQALLRHCGEVVTRTELEARALPHSEGQALDVHMSNLRRKIGEGYIRTVRGVGYIAQAGAAP